MGDVNPVHGGTHPGTMAEAADKIGGLNLLGEEQPQAESEPEEQKEEPTEAQESEATEEPEAESEATEVEAEQEAESEETETSIETLAQLAEALEADPTLLAELTDTFKADGDDVTVTLEELRRGYQRDANYRRQTSELAEARKALEAEHAQYKQQYEAQMVQTGQFLQQAEQMLVGEANTAEMQALRQSNPAEWAARREELQQRIGAVRQLYQQTAAQFDAYHKQQTEAAQAQMNELRSKELNNLRIAIPDWGDDLRGKLNGYLGDTYGFTDNDLSGVVDSRLIVLANKARLWDEAQKVGKQTKEKVVKLPKVQKPGKGTKTVDRKTVNIKNAKAKLKKSGKLHDAAAVIDQIMPKDY